MKIAEPYGYADYDEMFIYDPYERAELPADLYRYTQNPTNLLNHHENLHVDHLPVYKQIAEFYHSILLLVIIEEYETANRVYRIFNTEYVPNVAKRLHIDSQYETFANMLHCFDFRMIERRLGMSQGRCTEPYVHLLLY